MILILITGILLIIILVVIAKGLLNAKAAKEANDMIYFKAEKKIRERREVAFKDRSDEDVNQEFLNGIY